jgi:hypothetical protein
MHYCGRVGHKIHRYEGFQGVPDRPTGTGMLEARQSAGKRIRSGDEKRTVVSMQKTGQVQRLGCIWWSEGINMTKEEKEVQRGFCTPTQHNCIQIQHIKNLVRTAQRTRSELQRLIHRPVI